MDGRVLIFAAALSLLAGICFGLMPALKTTKSRTHAALKEGGRGGSGTRHRVQRALVAAEMALALVLLVGAGLMIRTLTALWNVSPGFDAKNVLTFGFSLSPSMAKASPEAIRAALREVHEKLQSAPGVQGISFSWGALPLSSDDEWLFWIDGQPKPASENDMNWALNYVVEPDYLKVMGVPLKSGRFFTTRDDEHAQSVAVIDDALAHKFFGDADPIGKRLHINSTDQVAEIVGVVGHVKQWGLDTDDKESLRAQLYTPFMQLPNKAMSQSASGLGVLVRSQGSIPVFESVRHASEQMSSQQVVFGAQTMNEIIANSLAARRFSMILLGIFAGLALVLASIGIYGVVSYVVGQRTQEIGVRMAMGAQRSEVLRLVLAQGAAMAAFGAAVGLVAALALTRLMGTMLFAVSSADPVTYLCVVALLFAVSMAACWIPARRAARMNPVDALRYE
jgi:predicted permease